MPRRCATQRTEPVAKAARGTAQYRPGRVDPAVEATRKASGGSLAVQTSGTTG
ncbi:unnamed protein product [Mycetohabitans rhizoxinica HKI 454]|uniref:Uncharacterized protein n=1 Tax=Mycetohabitans rhizoxinica (strain DSM 19002 / CIP 109453 / HKI 454) TaxID=882378 RepID=E5ALT1_MYCRK|nr:unnamed protein product [Mycetohabitans rhizoxinica HKI 454]